MRTRRWVTRFSQWNSRQRSSIDSTRRASKSWSISIYKVWPNSWKSKTIWSSSTRPWSRQWSKSGSKSNSCTSNWSRTNSTKRCWETSNTWLTWKKKTSIIKILFSLWKKDITNIYQNFRTICRKSRSCMLTTYWDKSRKVISWFSQWSRRIVFSCRRRLKRMRICWLKSGRSLNWSSRTTTAILPRWLKDRPTYWVRWRISTGFTMLRFRARTVLTSTTLSRDIPR